MPLSFLVVDDQVAIAWGLARMLSSAFPTAHVRMAHSTKESLDILQTFHPDLITTDVTRAKGEINGYGFLEQLRANPATADVPVLAATAQFLDEAKLYQSGFDAVLIKPFSMSDFIATVRYLLHQPSRL